jgi:hypothetical protein
MEQTQIEIHNGDEWVVAEEIEFRKARERVVTLAVEQPTARYRALDGNMKVMAETLHSWEQVVHAWLFDEWTLFLIANGYVYVVNKLVVMGEYKFASACPEERELLIYVEAAGVKGQVSDHIPVNQISNLVALRA